MTRRARFCAACVRNVGRYDALGESESADGAEVPS